MSDDLRRLEEWTLVLHLENLRALRDVDSNADDYADKILQFAELSGQEEDIPSGADPQIDYRRARKERRP